MTTARFERIRGVSQAPRRGSHRPGHGPRRSPLDVPQDTERRCAHCDKLLVRKEIHRARARVECELESLQAFTKRQFCDVECWRASQRASRGPTPSCLCGCGRPTRWQGQTKGWTHFAIGCNAAYRKPLHPPWVDEDPAFWDWFAGFVDGEGCFAIAVSHSTGREYPQPFFKIAVRADERPILEEIRDRLGCGRVRVHVPGASTSNLQLKFEMSSIADCQRLVEVLTAHPLRAKKRHDFETWAEAVAEKRDNGTSPRIWELRDKLMTGRHYNPRIAEGGDAA
jgi:hypothetical protein